MRDAVATKRPKAGPARSGLRALAAWAAVGGALVVADDGPKRDADAPKADPIAVGAELFHREWMPDDPRGQGGDGLGPAFNDSSCIACHNSGGSGGAGPTGKNIDILSASRLGGVQIAMRSGVPSTQTSPPAEPPAELEPLFALHAGFRAGGSSVVLHKFGTDPGYDAFRSKLLASLVVFDTRPFINNLGPISSVTRIVKPRSGFLAVPAEVSTITDGALPPVVLDFDASGDQARQDPRLAAALGRMNEVRTAALANRAGMVGTTGAGSFTVSRSQRNPTPLFGLGLVDAIPESAIVAMAARQAKQSPEIAGRPARVPDGRIGRLGWKGQTANSEDFVLNACAVEVGLEVPGHSQSMTPAGPPLQGAGPRPDPRRMRRPGRLRPGPAQAGRAGVADRRRGQVPGRRQGGVRQGRLRRLPRPQARRGRGALQRPPAARPGRRHRRQRLVQPQRQQRRGHPADHRDDHRRRECPGPAARRRAEGGPQEGVADPAALGLPRLRPLPPRRPGPVPGPGRRPPRRPGDGLGAPVLPALADRAGPARRVPQIARRPRPSRGRPRGRLT